MKLDNLIKMIFIVPKQATDAKTTEDLATAYFKKGATLNPDRATNNTFIRRHIDAMEELGMIDYVPLNKNAAKRTKRTERYFLKEGSIMHHFMNSKVALNLIWANNVMQPLGPVFDLKDVDSTARAARMNQREKALVEKIRLVPDGIGRKTAKIDAGVLSSCVSAIETNHTLMLRYHNRQNQVSDEIKESLERTVLGMVAKDGTIYVITCTGFDDTPTHIPMHRIEKAEETGTRGYARSDFNVDNYVSSQHQLSHIVYDQDNPIEMVLKVHPEAMFHFNERPISSMYGEQIVESPTSDDMRFTVKITVPFTVQLPPFIWSHAGWVEVVSPPSLRKYVGERLLAAASLYQGDVNPRFD